MLVYQRVDIWNICLHAISFMICLLILLGPNSETYPNLNWLTKPLPNRGWHTCSNLQKGGKASFHYFGNFSKILPTSIFLGITMGICHSHKLLTVYIYTITSQVAPSHMEVGGNLWNQQQVIPNLCLWNWRMPLEIRKNEMMSIMKPLLWLVIGMVSCYPHSLSPHWLRWVSPMRD
jgi:hypothetical protein